MTVSISLYLSYTMGHQYAPDLWSMQYISHMSTVGAVNKTIHTNINPEDFRACIGCHYRLWDLAFSLEVYAFILTVQTQKDNWMWDVHHQYIDNSFTPSRCRWFYCCRWRFAIIQTISILFISLQCWWVWQMKTDVFIKNIWYGVD